MDTQCPAASQMLSRAPSPERLGREYGDPQRLVEPVPPAATSRPCVCLDPQRVHPGLMSSGPSSHKFSQDLAEPGSQVSQGLNLKGTRMLVARTPKTLSDGSGSLAWEDVRTWP